MSTHVREIATRLFPAGLWTGILPAAPQPGNTTDGAWARRPSPAPNFPQLQAHLSRRESGPAPGDTGEVAGSPPPPYPSARGVPPSLSVTARPGPAPTSRDPQPSGSTSASAPRSGGRAQGGPGSQFPRADGVSEMVNASGPGPSPAQAQLSPATAAAAPRCSREGPRPDPPADRSALPLGRPGAEPGPLLSAATPRPGSRRRRRAPREGGRGRGAVEAADPRARVQSQAPDAGPGLGGRGGRGTGLLAPDKGQGRRRRA